MANRERARAAQALRPVRIPTPVELGAKHSDGCMNCLCGGPPDRCTYDWPPMMTEEDIDKMDRDFVAGFGPIRDAIRARRWSPLMGVLQFVLGMCTSLGVGVVALVSLREGVVEASMVAFLVAGTATLGLAVLYALAEVEPEVWLATDNGCPKLAQLRRDLGSRIRRFRRRRMVRRSWNDLRALLAGRR